MRKEETTDTSQDKGDTAEIPGFRKGSERVCVRLVSKDLGIGKVFDT
ncbi:hypothetical protein IC007_0547 [Sulfuracidifex tepidarius]|uniref:Uncharacterized protein n=1 Tax=Sulfuracidifex tepidarius TaxID=1294262 RepID=A0A510E0P8_9CREN|nr:hypothetical protein IC007_0547 [Sulfuracidifex tepidarius]